VSYVHSCLGYGGGMPSETRAPRAAFLGVEQSLTGRRWAARLGDERAALAIAQRHGLPDAVARLLAAREVDLEGVPDFLDPTLRKFLPDPLHLKDMDAAVARLVRAVRAGERIVVFGDYDVDGATSSALLLRFFRAVGGNIGVYIPDRRREGYGPNAPALLKLQQEGAAVVVTVDCGVTAFEPLAEARRAGLDLIVIDHHQAEIALPEAIAVVDPNRLDDASPHKQMAAVGVAFLLSVGVNRALREAGWYTTERPEPDLRQWLDLVALGTVCDVVPLTGVNRALVRQGLLVMAQRRNPGLAALADVARLKETPGAYHLGFMLGPRVNAGGRVGQADLGARLLSSDDPHEVGAICRRHEVDDGGTATLGLKLGFEDKRAGAVMPTDCESRLARSKQPTAVLGCPKQSGEACSRIEAWPAQPIDGAVAADQSRRLAVANQRIVFNPRGHGLGPLLSMPRPLICPQLPIACGLWSRLSSMIPPIPTGPPPVTTLCRYGYEGRRRRTSNLAFQSSA